MRTCSATTSAPQPLIASGMWWKRSSVKGGEPNAVMPSMRTRRSPRLNVSSLNSVAPKEASGTCKN